MSDTGEDRGLLGRTLSHFRLLQKLGEGGMGVVYRAHDTSLGRDVAIKLLPAGSIPTPQARASLLTEARIASRLKHPNICTIYEVGETQDQVFVAMEWVEGQSLKASIPVGGLPEESVVHHGAPLARALAHAHAHGVIHRDVKSSNIVIDAGGQAKLLDFGLSRRLFDELPGDPALARTSTGVVVGTPEYLAPELLQGGRANPASDVWALGVVLYEMCCGHVPFSGTNVATVVTAILHSTPAPLPDHVSPGLASVVSRCLTKDPLLRYRSADEVAAALDALLPGTAISPTLGRRFARPGSTLAAVVAAVLLTAVAVVLVFDVGGWRSRLGMGGGGIRSIAVLPLESLPRAGAQEYFADGMTEQLIGELAQLGGVRVISRTSVMPFKDARKSLAEIAFALDVDAVVEGSVQQDSGMVRIQVRLMNARSERLIWAGSFDRPLRNVLALQSDVAREVTQRIRAHLSSDERTRLATSREVDPLAFEHYLKGRYALYRRDSGAAIDEYRQAIRIDPLYSRAYAGLAHGYVLSHRVGDSTFQAVASVAMAAASRAVELDGSSPDGYLALANVQATLLWDLPAAENSGLRAMELGPSVAEAHHTYGLVAFALGRRPEAIRELQKSRELDPLNPYYHSQLAEALIFSRKYDPAISELEKLLALFPEDRIGRRDLGHAYLEKGDVIRAIAELEQLTPTQAQLARAFAKAGRTEDARHVLSGMELRFAQGKGTALDVAEIHASLGNADRAFEWLERSHAKREQLYLAVPFNPAFDALRADPRYHALAQRSPWVTSAT